MAITSVKIDITQDAFPNYGTYTVTDGTSTLNGVITDDNKNRILSLLADGLGMKTVIANSPFNDDGGSHDPITLFKTISDEPNEDAEGDDDHYDGTDEDDDDPEIGWEGWEDHTDEDDYDEPVYMTVTLEALKRVLNSTEQLFNGCDIEFRYPGANNEIHTLKATMADNSNESNDHGFLVRTSQGIVRRILFTDMKPIDDAESSIVMNADADTDTADDPVVMKVYLNDIDDDPLVTGISIR